MHVTVACPVCERPVRAALEQTGDGFECAHCEWSRPGPVSVDELTQPERCIACGCEDLWRQKDFPQRVGVALVALGALLSTIAWAYVRPVWAIGILMAFALLDWLLFVLMKDVVVCYRCGAQYRNVQPDEEHPRFNLETAERYRQEATRLEEARR